MVIYLARFTGATARLVAVIVLCTPAIAEVVLLRNGASLEGRVERYDGQVIVRSEGSVLRLRAARVAHVAASKLALYEWRRGQLGSRSTAIDHLELADWALANELTPQASLELLDARQLDPHNPRLKLLERRLVESLRPQPEVIQQTNSERGSAASSTESAAEARAATIKLPDGTREYFSRRVQLWVLNGCGAGGCHGGGHNGADVFLLDPTPLRGYGTAGVTERNLAAVLATIDLEAPDESPLLKAARGPHAGVRPFDGPHGDELIQRLTAWAGGIAAANASSTQASTPMPPPEKKSLSADRSPAVAADSPLSAEESLPSPKMQEASLAEKRPRDEFDPEIFNTRFRRPQDDLPTPATR